MTPETAESSADTRPAAGNAKLIVFLVVFIDLLGFGIVLPLLPRIADTFLADASRAVKGLTIGVIYSSFSAMQFFFAPVWGRWSDRVGRRPVLLIGLAGSVVFYALFGFASDLPASSAWLAVGLLLLSRVGAGVAGATIATAQAVIADASPPEQRARGMALIGAAFGIGFTFGPLIAYGAIQAFTIDGAVGYTAAGLSGVALLLALFVLPETRVAGSPPRHRRRGFAAMGHALKDPAVGALILLASLATFSFANFEGTLSVLTERFDYAKDDNFLIFAYIGGVLIVAQVVYRGLVRGRDPVTFVRLGVVLMAAGLLGLAALTSAAGSGSLAEAETAWLFGSITVAVTGFAFMTPSAQGLISSRSPDDRQGEILGINQSFNALARIMGPFVGLMLFYAAGSALPYFFAGAVLASLLLLLPRVGRGS